MNNKSLLLVFCAAVFLITQTAHAQTRPAQTPPTEVVIDAGQSITAPGTASLIYLPVPVSGKDLKKLVGSSPDWQIQDTAVFMVVISGARPEDSNTKLHLRVPGKDAFNGTGKAAPNRITLSKPEAILGGMAYMDGGAVDFVWRVDEEGRRISAFRPGEVVKLMWIRL